MGKCSHSFKAYALFWIWTNGTETPVYKSIPGRDHPWFATKREAKAFMRENDLGKSKCKSFRWAIKQVTLEMTWEHEGDGERK
jgi:hypothetical protein